MTTKPPAPKSQIEQMVDRFLGWKLPKGFTPDNGISFAKTYNTIVDGKFVKDYPRRDQDWTIGTNLFSADEARQMITYLLEGVEPPAPVGMPPEPSGYEFMLTYSEGSDGRAVAEYAKALRTWATAEIARLAKEKSDLELRRNHVESEWTNVYKRQIERAEAAERRVSQSHESHKITKRTLDIVLDERNAAIARNAELTAALKADWHYSDHTNQCQVGNSYEDEPLCDCGYDEAALLVNAALAGDAP